jgi:hypothetical protein
MEIKNVIGIYRSRKWDKRPLTAIEHLVVHHSVTNGDGKSNDQQLRELQSIHEGQGWPGLSYHNVITRDGTLYQCNDQDDLTWTVLNLNRQVLSVCLIGNFESQDPTKEQLQTLDNLLRVWSNESPQFPAGQKDVKYHGELIPTACCGLKLRPYILKFRETGNLIDDITAPTPTENTNITNENEMLQQKMNAAIEQLKNNHPDYYDNWGRAIGNTDMAKQGKEDIIWIQEMTDQMMGDFNDYKANNPEFHLKNEHQLTQWVKDWGINRLRENGIKVYTQDDVDNLLMLQNQENQKVDGEKVSDVVNNYETSGSITPILISQDNPAHPNYFDDIVRPKIKSVSSELLTTTEKNIENLSGVKLETSQVSSIKAFTLDRLLAFTSTRFFSAGIGSWVIQTFGPDQTTNIMAIFIIVLLYIVTESIVKIMKNWKK